MSLGTDRLNNILQNSRINFLNTVSIPEIELPEPSFEGATHFCNSIVNLFSSPDLSSLPIGKLFDGDQLKAIELDLGDNFEFGLFENSSGDRFYAKESDILSLGTILKRVKPFKKLGSVPFQKFTDLKSAGFNMPFFMDGEYLVKFDTGMKDKAEVLSRIEDFKLLGVKEIVDYYGKMATDLDYLDLKDSFGFISMKDILTPTRAGSSHELILSVKSRYLDSLPDRNIEYFQNFYNNVLSTNFKCREFSDIISNLSSILNKNHDSIKKFTGLVEGINLKKLSEKNFGFFNDLKGMLKENGYVLENMNLDSKMELGFDPDTLEMVYLMIFDGENPGKFLNVGINKLSLNTDTKLSKLLLNAKDIINSSGSELGWQEFLSSYFAGDYLILFNKLQENLGLNIPISELESTFEEYRDAFEDPIKSARDALELSNLVESDEFKDITSQILAKARDQIGDNFLLNLTEIIENIDDLESLYELVFDKISVEELSSMLLEKAAEELGLKDINEIIARAVMKKMKAEESIRMIFDNFTEENIKEMLNDMCLNYDFGFEEIEMFLETFETNLYSFILHYDDDGKLDGMLTEAITSDGKDFVKEKLDELGYTDCVSLFVNLKYRDIFETNSAREIICRILQGNIPSFTNPCKELAQDIIQLLSNPPTFQSLKLDIKASLMKLDPIKIKSSFDFSFKKFFSRDPNFFQRLNEIPKFRTAFSKQSKTRNKLFKRNAGTGIDLEIKSSDRDFSLPSISISNPKFDFSSFQFQGLDDIFDSTFEGIESSIKSSIEDSLVISFKSLLMNLLESLKGGFDLSAPDFGGENICDLFDASNGLGLDLALEGLLPKFEARLNSLKAEYDRRRLSNYSGTNIGDFDFLPKRRINGIDSDLGLLGIKIGVLDPPNFGDIGSIELPNIDNLNLNTLDFPDLLDLEFNKSEIEEMLNQISDNLKPKEVFDFLRGNLDKFDFPKISSSIKNPKIKLVMDEDLLSTVSETCSELIDLDLIDQLEEIYDSREPIGTLCENLGINYGLSPYPSIKNIAEVLKENYNGLTDRDIIDITSGTLEKLKDDVSDAIGKAGVIDLPFNSDPDSFMPNPKDIPAMDYANTIMIDALFDPIEAEYKKEASVYSDNLFVERTSSHDDPSGYVRMYYEYGDKIVSGYDEESGKLILESVEEDYRYNLEFESYYKTSGASLFYKDENGIFLEYGKTTAPPRPTIQIVSDVNSREQTRFGENNFYCDIDDRRNIYVKKDTTELQPPLSVRESLANNSISFSMSGTDLRIRYGQSEIEYVNSSSMLSYQQNECEDTTEINTQESTSPYSRFASPVLEVNKDLYRGQEYIDSVLLSGESILEVVYRDINEYVAEKLQNIYSDSRLFITQNLYTMIIDSEDIDLLNMESIKKSVKSDYDKKFSFKYDGQIYDSSKIGLAKTKIKIYILEILLRSCFTLDTFYNIPKMPNQFVEKVKHAFEKDNNDNLDYINDVYDTLGTSFDSIVEETYSEVIEKLGLVFENAARDSYELFSSLNNRFINIVENQVEKLGILAMESMQNNVRAIIMSYYVDENGKEYEQRTDDTQQRFRLCFLGNYFDIPEGLSAVEGLGDDRYEYVQGVNPSEIESRLGTDFRFMFKTEGSISQTVAFSSNLDNGSSLEYQTLSIIPLIDSDTDDYRDMINTFISEYALFSDINDLFVTEVARLVSEEAPNIIDAFASTKEFIRNTYISLKNSQETYDNDDKSLSDKVGKYSEGVGTLPDYSKIARKMALQTIPMIVKGMAESYDTNIQIGSVIRAAADLKGVNIPPQISSLIAFGATNFTIPPGPLGLMYLASGYLEPKERKRIKEIANNRSTKEDVAINDAQTIIEELENAGEQSRQEALIGAIDSLATVSEMLYNEYGILRSRYFTGGVSEDSDFRRYVLIPRGGFNLETFSDTKIYVDDLWNELGAVYGGTKLSSKLLSIVNNFESIINRYSSVLADILGDERLTENAVENELLEQSAYEEVRRFTINSLRATYWIVDLLNTLAVMYYNIRTEVQRLPYVVENSFIDIEEDYNPRRLSESKIYQNYKDNRQKDSAKYRKVLDSASEYYKGIARWTIIKSQFDDVNSEYANNNLTYSEANLPSLIQFLKDEVIPYLKDNGY